MKWIATREEFHEMDRRAETDYGIPVRTLMEGAGRALAEFVIRRYGHDPVVVVAGAGNNGGDGIAAARILHQHSHSVSIVLVAEKSKLNQNCRTQYEEAVREGVKFSEKNCTESDIATARVILDAIFGTGLSRELGPDMIRVVNEINRTGAKVISVDIPSGLDCDSGKILGAAVRATTTLTFGAMKRAMFQGEGAELCGSVHLLDIGFPACITQEARGAYLLERKWVLDQMPKRQRSQHKRSAGRVFVVAGSEAIPGAAVLAVKSAYRSGAGYVTLASPQSVCEQVVQAVPESLIFPLNGDFSDLGEFEHLMSVANSHDAILLGPGIGIGDKQKAGVGEFLRQVTTPIILDADALTLISQLPDLNLRTPTVLTPHSGEMARLLGWEVQKVDENRFETLTAAVKRWNCTVVFKGANSLVGSPGKPIAVNPTGNPGMAVAGMGDVLAGMIVSLTAQGLDILSASQVGVYWHGAVADHLHEKYHRQGFLPTDIIEHLFTFFESEPEA